MSKNKTSHYVNMMKFYIVLFAMVLISASYGIGSSIKDEYSTLFIIVMIVFIIIEFCFTMKMINRESEMVRKEAKLEVLSDLMNNICADDASIESKEYALSSIKRVMPNE